MRKAKLSLVLQIAPGKVQLDPKLNNSELTTLRSLEL